MVLNDSVTEGSDGTGEVVTEGSVTEGSVTEVSDGVGQLEGIGRFGFVHGSEPLDEDVDFCVQKKFDNWN